MRRRSSVQLAFVVSVCLAAPGCEDDDASPTGPSPVVGNAPSDSVSGAQQVRGTERLAWSQAGDTSRLRFRAYVDGRPVDLPSATCSGGECGSPLPSMNDGVHAIALANVSAAGVESERSEPITVQKVSTGVTAYSLPLASARGAALRPTPAITIGGLEFTADIVATGVRAPAQLAALPDGRLLVSEADGNVRVVYPGEEERREPALEARLLTALPPAGPMAIVGHPDFATNQFVYLSLLEPDRAGAMRLRVLRLREVADTLGEPATLFEAAVAASHEIGDELLAGPRMAFGPDRLLYLMLPAGLKFVNEPAASSPVASMLRLSDDGRVPGDPLSGIVASPLAFTWSATGDLWVMFRGADGVPTVRSFAATARVRGTSAGAAKLRVREGTGAAGATLFMQSAPDNLLVAQALVASRADGSKGMARLALPVQADGGLYDRIGDVVAGNGGTLFVTTNNAVAGVMAGTGDVVMRLRPSARTRTARFEASLPQR
jgi:glucose/arabinose dehydrogenase